MNQEQLHPHFNQDFICNNCQRKFYNETAYSPTKEPVFLTETYCTDCTEEETEFCSFNEIDDKTKKRLLALMKFLIKKSNYVALIIGKSEKDLMSSLKICP